MARDQTRAPHTGNTESQHWTTGEVSPVYLFLVVMSLRHSVRAYSSCAEWELLLVRVQRPLSVGASRCSAWAVGYSDSVTAVRSLGSCGSWAYGLSCSLVCGIFPDQASNPMFPALASIFLSTVQP